jgi:hypothetical protein
VHVPAAAEERGVEIVRRETFPEARLTKAAGGDAQAKHDVVHR